MRILPSGDRAVLVEVADTDAALALHRALEADRRPGVVDLVPGARTVLVTGSSPAALAAWVSAVAGRPAPPAPGPGREIVIPVRYDGPDLDQVGRLTGLGAAGVVARHTAVRWRAAFSGFAPGFAYLVAEAPELEVPRLAEPREAVPAGSVALAGGYCGIYPRRSPGGWRLLGTTDVPLWDDERGALIAPGTVVLFTSAS